MVEFDYIYKQYHKYIATIIYNFINDDPSDILQMTFIKLNESKYALKSEQLAKSFLKKVSINLCVSHLKLNKNRSKLNRRWHESEYESEIDATDEEIEQEAERLLIYLDVMPFIYDQIKMLPHDMRNVFESFYVDKKTAVEISIDLNITNHTVYSHLSNARRLLKSKILAHKKNALQLLTKRPTL